MHGGSSSTTRRANVLLIGSGRMGRIRASLLNANPKFNVLGVVDVDSKAASEIAEKYGFGSTFKDLSSALIDEGVINAGGVDGIVISTPTFTHGEIMEKGAEEGFKMFTEKPIEESGER